MSKTQITGIPLSTRMTFTSDGETEQFDRTLPEGRGHQFTLDIQCANWTGQHLKLYQRGVGEGMRGDDGTSRSLQSVASLERPVYQKRGEVADRAGSTNITANGIYDIRGDATHLVIVATMAGTPVPILVDVHQLVG